MVAATDTIAAPAHSAEGRGELIAFVVMVALLVVAPFFIYPLFLMQALCFALGVIVGLTKVFYPQASATVVFVVMVIVLLVRPRGLFGRAA